MNLLAKWTAWLTAKMNGLFELLRGPIASLPPWLTLTILSALLGIVLLILFKYTSNQSAIGRVRDRIKSRLLAMKLFKDNIPVVLKCQLQVFTAAIMLLVYSLPPMLVMILPFGLILGQLGVWYQAAPLGVNEHAVVIMQLSETENAPVPTVSLLPSSAYKTVTGPVRVPAKRQVLWTIQATQPGTHPLQFKVGNSEVKKTLSVGSDFMPVSIKRPSLHIGDIILYPAEKPFDTTSPVHSIEIGYPERTAPLTGSGSWVITLFVISMLGAFAVKPFFNVKI